MDRFFRNFGFDRRAYWATGCFGDLRSRSIAAASQKVRRKQCWDLHWRWKCSNIKQRPSADAIRRGIEINLVGQSKIYLRPIQRNLSTESLIPYEVKERCTNCKKKFPMSELRTHSFYMRTAGLISDSDSEGQTTKESHTLKSKVHALPVDNPL